MIERILTCANEHHGKVAPPQQAAARLQQHQFLLLVLSIAAGLTAPLSPF
jgi:hypothetical protein